MAGIDELYNTMIREAAASAGSAGGDGALRFAFITDLHHKIGGNTLRSAEAIRELAKRVPLDFVLCGGDVGYNGPKAEVVAALREIIGALRVPGIPLLTAKGNHDDNSIYAAWDNGGPEHFILPDETRELLMPGVPETAMRDLDSPTDLYYAADFPSKKTRVIVLDCNDIPYARQEDGSYKYNGINVYAFSSRQLNWLAGQALDLRGKPGWRVLVVSHVEIVEDGVFGTDHPVTNGEALWGVLKAFKEGGRFASEGGAGGDFAYRVRADFAAQGPGTIIGCLFGHVHHDNVAYKDGIPMVSTLNAWTHKEFDVSPERRDGTATEAAFDIMTADFERSRLNAFRFGAGQHRAIDF